MKTLRSRCCFLALLPLAVTLVAPSGGAHMPRRCSVALAGDLNDDGCSDLAVAERGRGAVDFLKDGPEPTLDRIWIFSGKDGELLRTLRRPRSCPAFGRALENVGDVNGDGKPELAVSGGGPLWVFSGADGSVLFELAGELRSPGFGHSLAGGDDVDPGFSNLHSGATGDLLQSLSGYKLKPLPSKPPGLYDVDNKGVGIDTCALGDTNGDGKSDVAVHMPAMEEVRILSGVDYSTLVKVSLTPHLKHNRQ